MSSPWSPEWEVSEAEARDAVRTCDLAGDDVRIVAAGWDNTIGRDADTELRARVTAIFSAASVAAYARELDDRTLLASATTGLVLAAR